MPMTQLKLDRPRDSDLHTLADFAELLCLGRPDRVLSHDDLRDHLHDAVDDEKDASRYISDDILSDLSAQIAWRETAFGAVYPFKLDSNGRALKAEDPLSPLQTGYALLLLCANLAHVDRAHRHGLTEAFERTSLCALARLWPAPSKARCFGKNNSDYTGTKMQRLTKLCEDIGARPLYTASHFRDRDSGDGGIDLVAWRDLDDYEKFNIPAALAQCACSRAEWSVKQAEISGVRLRSGMAPTHPWMQVIFIPHSFRGNDGRWAVASEPGETVVVDRLRILRHLDIESEWNTIDPPPFLAEMLASRDELV